MDVIRYAEPSSDLGATMDRVCEDHTPVVITRGDKQAVVMLSLEDYVSLEETAYLMRTPANAQRLLESIEALESGRGTRREVDLEA